MAHPYAGADTFEASITLNDDGVDAPNFTNMNTPSEGLGDRTAYCFKRARSLNWLTSYLPNPSGGGPITTVCCAGYDTLTSKWLIGGHPSGDDFVATGYGDPSGWVALPTVTGGILASGVFKCIVRGNEPSLSPASKYIYAPYIVGTSSVLHLVQINTAASSAAQATAPTGSATTVKDCQIVTIPGVIIAATSATAAAQSNVYFSTNSASSWTAQTALTISSAIAYWLIATNPSNQIVAIPGQIQPTYITSTNGTTWTSQSGLTGLLSTEVVTALVWTDDGTGLGCWLLSTVDDGASAGTIRLHRSYDGVTWSSVTHDLPIVGSGIFYLSNMSDARILVGVFDESPARIVYSLNGGGHWATCRTEAPLPATVSGYPTNSKLISGPNQTALAAGALLFLSTAIGDPGGVGLQ